MREMISKHGLESDCRHGRLTRRQFSGNRRQYDAPHFPEIREIRKGLCRDREGLCGTGKPQPLWPVPGTAVSGEGAEGGGGVAPSG